MPLLSDEFSDRIERLLDAGVDMTSVIELIDQLDGDTDMENVVDENIEGDAPFPWQSYSWSAPRECLHCGHIHTCKGDEHGT